jgi:hypothetical protein
LPLAGGARGICIVSWDNLPRLEGGLTEAIWKG